MAGVTPASAIAQPGIREGRLLACRHPPLNATFDVMNPVHEALQSMAKSLASVDHAGAAYLRRMAARTPQEIADDLSIWGGSGSLMVQSHIPDPLNLRASFEGGAIQLTKAFVAAGAKNRRMEWWASPDSPPSEAAA